MNLVHDSLPIDARLDTLLRQIVTTHDLLPEQDARVRDRLGLQSHHNPSIPTHPPVTRDSVGRVPAGDHVLPASSASPAATPRRWSIAWLQFAAGGIAILLVGLLLVALFSTMTGGDDARRTVADSSDRYDVIVPWSPDGASGAEKLYAVPLDGSEPRRLIPGEPGDTFSEWAPDVAPDGRVAFVSDRDGQPDLYIWDGANPPRRVTTTAWAEEQPAWSPDGTRIMFTGPSAERDVAQIWVVNADGQALARLTDRGGGAVNPAWSPDGAQIAFLSIGAREPGQNGWTASVQLWVMSSDGADQRQITRIEPAVASFAWLPDSQRLLATGTQPTIVTTGGDVVRELVPDRQVIGEARPSPSGRQIALVSPTGDDSRGPTALLVVDTDGGDLREVTRQPDVLWGVTWSPNGEQIAYTRGTAPAFETGPPPDLPANWTLAVVDRDSGDERTLLEGIHRADRIVWRETTPKQQNDDPLESVREALQPLPPGQERRIVLDAQAYGQHDNAFDRWTVELWERWAPDGVLDQGLYVSDPSGAVVAHIVLDGQQRLMNWEPRDALGVFDVPLEYSLQRRVLGATLAAVSGQDSYSLRRDERDGQIVYSFEWQGDGKPEYRDISQGEMWIDPKTGQLQRIVYLVDRPDLEPTPSRAYSIRDLDILPAGSSPPGTYEIASAPIPDEMGVYRDITLEQAQAIVPFGIVMPERVPEGLEPPAITVVASPPDMSATQPLSVEASFDLSGDESPRQAVQFLQMSPSTGAPRLDDSAPPFTFPVNAAGGESVTVTRTTGRNAAGDPLLAYWWERDGIGYQILAAPAGDLAPRLVEQLMLSILLPPAPTADEQAALLERERREMTPYPIPDSCSVSAWTGPDVRVRQTDAVAYFIDGAGLTLGTMRGLLSTGENEIVWLAGGPLTTSQALSGPEIIRGVQLDRGDATTEIPIEVTGQIYDPIIPDDVERAWTSTVTFPSEGCWEISVTVGAQALNATVYVYPR